MNQKKVIEAAEKYAQAVKWLHRAQDEQKKLRDRSDALNNRIEALRNNVYEASDNLNGWALEEYE